ncbi:MAG: deoxyguanosinetriphosphate triphosphohydrolase [Clostridiales bacterium GWE2_32_10]|nr:MAG: deoxyguanosinetriphosphate triphosphohydrolase [Clostridiales bacterium GWE2_32_10]HBY19617.1 deoxyguanosinetriphosphate triphosphohydrolase [Clostridiales bacterium]
MNIREMQEQNELKTLSEYATHSVKSKGRKREVEKCTMRTEFQRDRDRIIHSKAFRRLMHKTQVFIMPEGDHYRNRLIHTMEVKQIACSIANALRLNVDLTEAIALGHDLGHTPFGHSGEHVLNEHCTFGFEHNEQSVRVVDILENDGYGLNLTYEVIDGILNHQTDGNPATLEGKIVQISDKIAYVNHDIEDAIRAGIIKEENLPQKHIMLLGKNKSERIHTMIMDIVYNSQDKPDIIISDEIRTSIYELRRFLFENVYIDSRSKTEEKKVQNLISNLFEFYIKDTTEVEEHLKRILEKHEMTKERMVCDYIAGMTDRYAIKKFKQYFLPMPWEVY